jgi:hypothetical protein
MIRSSEGLHPTGKSKAQRRGDQAFRGPSPLPRRGYSAGSNNRLCRYTWSRRPAPGPATPSTAPSRRHAPGPRRRPAPGHVHPMCTGSWIARRNRRSNRPEGVSRPVGRVLCLALREAAVIHLGPPLPTASCGLPAGIGRAALKRSRRHPGLSRKSPLDLAPGGVYQAAPVTWGAGGLLHHRFTLTPPLVKNSGAVCFLWHCPAGHPGSALPTTLPCGARTFLTGPRGPARPPGRLTRRQDTAR